MRGFGNNYCHVWHFQALAFNREIHNDTLAILEDNLISVAGKDMSQLRIKCQNERLGILDQVMDSISTWRDFITVASSNIAATLLDGKRTVLKLPFNIEYPIK